MTRSLRRSRRAPRTKNSDYNQGDIVEINRNGSILKGRLAQLLTAGTSPNPRWLVKFDGQPQKDEEMYEHAFGRLLASYEDEDPDSPSPAVPSTAVSRKTSSGSNNSGGNQSARRGSGGGTSKHSGTSSEGEEAKPVVKANKAVQFEPPNAGSDSSSPENALGPNASKRARDKVSAREARSRRRQAKIDEETVPEVPHNGKKRPPPHTLASSKKQKRNGEDSEVVKVKLLTGTLYLYRGVHRRAEFVRRV